MQLGWERCRREVLKSPESVGSERLEVEDRLSHCHAGHLAESRCGVAPVVDRQDGRSDVEGAGGERECLGDGSDSGTALCGALTEHCRGRFDGNDRTVVGLVVPGAGSDVEHGGGEDLCGDARILDARGGVGPSDLVVPISCSAPA
jgi:hypothetical protein